MSFNFYKKYFQICFGLVTLFVLSYNFYIAESTKYDAYGDAEEFVSLGASLAQKQKYGHLKIEGGVIKALQNNAISQENYAFGGYSTWRPPIWPFLISGVFLLFGYKLIYLILFKFLLHLIGLFLFYKTLELLKLKEFLIIIGTFFYAINPAWQLYSRVFLSEPITFFLITLWIYLLIRYLKGKSGFFPQAFIAGIVILSHPYFIFLPFSIWFVALLKKKISLKLFIFSSLICTIIISTWVIRNSFVLDTPHLVLTTSSGAVMAKGWNAEVLKEHTNTRGDLANEGLVLENYSYDKKAFQNEVTRMKIFQKASIHFIQTNPEMIVPIINRKFLSAFNPFPETAKPGVLETGRWFFQLLALLSLFYLIFFSKNELIRSLAIGLILATIGITILTYSGFRFRMPQVGLELLLTIYVINDIYQKIIEKLQRRVG